MQYSVRVERTATRSSRGFGGQTPVTEHSRFRAPGSGCHLAPPGVHRTTSPTMGEGTNIGQELSLASDIPLLITPETEIWDIDTASADVEYGQFVNWNKIPDINPHVSHHGEELPQNPKDLKKLAREGHFAQSQQMRSQAYSQIIQGINCRLVTPDALVYRDISERLFRNRSVSSHPLPEFLDDILMPTYCLSEQGVMAVQKILICISDQFPDITYSPILPEVVALLLHYSEGDAACFEQVCRLIACMDTKKCYIDQSLIAYEASCMTFGDLAKKHCQTGHRLIATTSEHIFDVYSEWVMWVFGDLPFEYAIRVFDSYLLEGSKVLYRVALALLKQYRHFATSREVEIADVKEDLQKFVQSISRYISVDKLLEKAFRIRLFSHKEIWLLQLANRKALSERGISVTERSRQSAYMSVDMVSFSSTIVTAQEMRIVWSWIPDRFAISPPVLLYSTADHGYSLQRFYSHCEGYEPTVLLIKTTVGEVCGAFLSSDWNERKKNCGLVCSFFGTGECFVFTVRPEMEKYQWVVVRKAEMRKAPPSPRPRSRSRTSSFGSASMAPTSRLSTSPSAAASYLSVPGQGAADRLSPYLSLRHFQLPSKTASMFMSGSHEGIIIGGGGGQALNIDADLNNGRTQACETFDNPPLCQEHFQVQVLEVWGFQNS